MPNSTNAGRSWVRSPVGAGLEIEKRFDRLSRKNIAFGRQRPWQEANDAVDEMDPDCRDVFYDKPVCGCDRTGHYEDDGSQSGDPFPQRRSLFPKTREDTPRFSCVLPMRVPMSWSASAARRFLFSTTGIFLIKSVEFCWVHLSQGTLIPSFCAERKSTIRMPGGPPADRNLRADAQEEAALLCSRDREPDRSGKSGKVESLPCVEISDFPSREEFQNLT